MLGCTSRLDIQDTGFVIETEAAGLLNELALLTGAMSSLGVGQGRNGQWPMSEFFSLPAEAVRACTSAPIWTTRTDTEVLTADRLTAPSADKPRGDLDDALKPSSY